MIYLLLNSNQIKILYLKKTLLGHYDIVFYEKKYQMNFLRNGQLVNPDLTASAVKEALTLVSNSKVSDRDVTLILPQTSFEYLRTEVPTDMAPAVLGTYVKEKARAQLTVDLETSYHDHMLMESEGKKQMIFYALDQDVYNKFLEPFNLLDLKVRTVYPETLAFYKLFEKTLRKEKKENIFYVNYDGNHVAGYIYDSFGLLENEKWKKELKEKETIEDVLKAKAQEFEKKGYKLNRLILSGEESENIRQDTFTKNVGVWTNPLKRIMPHFYADYLKMFTSQGNKTIPYLQFDACIGAFILATENKDFSLFKRKLQDFTYKSYKAKGFSFPVRPVLMFLGAFLITTGVLFGLSRINWSGFKVGAMPSFLSFAKPTATPTPEPTRPPTPTLTPTPEVDRAEVRVKVLNGGGVAGKATEVRTILREAGYSEILTGNADNFEYETTEIRTKAERKELFGLLKEDLSENVTAIAGDELEEDEAADVIVVIGSDFK
jgi:hypothetical protein